MEDLSEVHAIITSTLAQRIASIVGLEYSEVNMKLPLTDVGLDSLSSTEVENWIARDFDAAVPCF